MRSRPVLVLAMLVACDHGADVFDEPLVYAIQLVEPPTGTLPPTVADCEAAQPDPGGLFINCWRTLTLCPDGRAELLVTDIVNGGRYHIDGPALVATSAGPREVGARATFRFAVDCQSAVCEASGETCGLWDSDDERAPFAQTTCGRVHIVLTYRP